ncbi:MAG: glycosyltransferase [Acidimicrobiales bacterium]
MSTPTFSVLMPVWHPNPEHLREAVDSVLDQTTSSWELIAVCDGPQPDDVMAVLNIDHPQIVVVQRPEQGGIIAASADGLAAATGEFVALLDNDDVLPLDALGSIAWELSRWPDVDFLYTDEDKLDVQGRRRRAYLKPGWSPERLRSNMYVGHLGVYRRSLVNEVGGFREGFDGSQDHDLALRVTERARRIVHVPRICYHWRESDTSTALDPSSKDWAFDAGVRAVTSHMERCGIPATGARKPQYPGFIDLVPNPDTDFGLVSIIIPTSGGSKLVEGRTISLIDNAVTSIVEKSTYDNYEIVVVLDSHGTNAVADRIKALSPQRVRVVRDPQPFSFAGVQPRGP